jgi:hypothetical protein
MACRGSPVVHVAYFDHVETTGVKTLGVDFPVSCLLVSLGLCSQKWNLNSASLWNAWRRSASVCQRRVLWLPRLMLPADCILRRRRDLRLRFARCVLLFPWDHESSRLRDDRRCDARGHFASVLSCGFPRLMYALYGILSRRRDDRLRFASVASYGFPRLLYIIYGIVDPRRDNRRQFASIYSCAFTNSCTLYMDTFVGVSTLGVGLWLSCRMASRFSSSLELELKSSLRR